MRVARRVRALEVVGAILVPPAMDIYGYFSFAVHLLRDRFLLQNL
jgi:hypothetical protein